MSDDEAMIEEAAAELLEEVAVRAPPHREQGHSPTYKRARAVATAIDPDSCVLPRSGQKNLERV